jgi:hypothetical protein
MNIQHRQLSKGWKQPIPVGLYTFFEEDILALNLFIHLLMHARNEDMKEEGWYMGKPYKLTKGQTIFGKQRYSQYLRCSPSGAHKVLMRLQDGYKVVDTKPSHNFTVVTIKNHEEVTGMWTASSQQRDTKETQSDTNKIVKNDKTVESVVTLTQYEKELNELSKVCETIFEHEKRCGNDTRRLYSDRRRTFSAEEIQGAFKNILNEPDLFKIKHNASRSLSWWLSSDDRIEEMLNCHLNDSSSNQ